MNEILRAIGLTPPAIAIIVGLGTIIYFIAKKMVAQVINMDRKDKQAIKKSLEEIKADVEKIKEENKLQNKGLRQVIYHQCLSEAMKWKDKGYIEGNAKIQFNIMWNQYCDLGDGLGDDPKKIIEQLEIK